MSETIACVTGASGMVGSRIANRLAGKGYRVRGLSRRRSLDLPSVEPFCGGLEDETVLKTFLSGAGLLFHCAAELNDASRMWEVNVHGTARLLRIAKESNIRFLCYLSSAGVVGLTDRTLVDENCNCNPQNDYEKSKWAAEQLVAKGIDGCSIVILRPTDVVDEWRPGAMSPPIRRRFRDRLVVLFKGNENAHIVHAEDIADAAVHFLKSHFKKPEVFFVSCDHERYNTFGGLWELYGAVQRKVPADEINPKHYSPIFLPYILRRIRRGPCNFGNVRYSSEKLLSKGFRFRLGVEGAVRLLARTNQF